MGFAYLAALLASSACMLLLDWRFRLFYWRDWRAAAIVTAIGVGALLLVDVAGIAFGIFRKGDGDAATGVMLAPHFPLEEPFFLIFMVLCTMVLYTGSLRVIESRRRA
ncbi:MAG: lycopene cyclase domain-containing protein [Demequina sp.]